MDKLNSVSFDRWVSSQDPYGTSSCSLDLRGIRLITPTPLVQLAALCHALAREGRRPRIVLDDVGVSSYLVRSGFVEVVKPVVDFSSSTLGIDALEYAYQRGSNQMLVEVTSIEDSAALSDVLDRIVSVLRDQFQYRERAAFDAAIAVSEIAQNTFDHNGHPCGFLAMQVYTGSRGTFLEIGVADHGAGLTATLARNPKNGLIVSDQDAIQQAMRLGTSEHDDPTRGTGLYHLLEIAYAHEGSAQIRSGSAKIRFRMDKRRGWVVWPVYSLPGVQIALMLQAKAQA